MQENHDWNRRHAAQSFLSDSAIRIKELRPKIIRDFPDLFKDIQFEPSMGKEEARKLYFACSGGLEDLKRQVHYHARHERQQWS